jgi:hypothetical protein
MISDIERRKRSKIQFNRIKAAVSENWPYLEVVFDANPVENTLRFYVETQDHVRMIETSGNLTLDELEKRTEDQLREALVSLSGGRL